MANAKVVVKNEDQVAAPSKASISRTIYLEEQKIPGRQRKDVIARYKAEAGMTDAGAATYYQTNKAKFGALTPAPVAEPATQATQEPAEATA